MNLVYVDALFRHLLWTGDLAFARRRMARARAAPGVGAAAVPPHLRRRRAAALRGLRGDLGQRRPAVPRRRRRARLRVQLLAQPDGRPDRAARIGADAAPYAREADAIARGMRAHLWLDDQGAFGEFKDLLGLQRVHPSAAVWTFYHAMDAGLPTPDEAWRMARDVDRRIPHLPVRGPGVPEGLHVRVDHRLDAVHVVDQQRRAVRDRAHGARLLAGGPAGRGLPPHEGRAAREHVHGDLPRQRRVDEPARRVPPRVAARLRGPGAASRRARWSRACSASAPTRSRACWRWRPASRRRGSTRASGIRASASRSRARATSTATRVETRFAAPQALRLTLRGPPRPRGVRDDGRKRRVVPRGRRTRPPARASRSRPRPRRAHEVAVTWAGRAFAPAVPEPALVEPTPEPFDWSAARPTGADLGRRSTSARPSTTG